MLRWIAWRIQRSPANSFADTTETAVTCFRAAKYLHPSSEVAANTATFSTTADGLVAVEQSLVLLVSMETGEWLASPGYPAHRCQWVFEGGRGCEGSSDPAVTQCWKRSEGLGLSVRTARMTGKSCQAKEHHQLNTPRE